MTFALSWRAGLCGLTVFFVGTGALWAGGTRFWRQTTPKDFDEGEATASVVLPTGEVAAGFKGTRLALDAGFVYAGALTADGKTAFFGSGDQGRIFAVSLGKPGATPTVKKLADLEAPWVTALSVRRDGSLLAGSTPGGRVFVLDPVKGEPKVFAKLAAEHIWTLAHDGATGTTYVATGAPGKVFALERDGKGSAKPMWDSGDKQVVTLLPEAAGSFLAGTSSEAIVYRVKKNGQAEALHDFDADEVRAMVRVGEATYIAVNDFPADFDLSSLSSSAAATAPKGTKVVAPAGAPVAIGSTGRGSAGSTVKARAAVYRLADAGSIEQVFTLADGYLTALAADGHGGVLAASGSQGKVYRLLPDRTFALAADLSERQALVLLPLGDGFLVGTGDVGGVYEMKPAASGQASYLSKVFDGEVFSQWGRVRWTGGPGLLIDTRSGNTAKPDKSWNDWKRVEGASFDGADGEGKVVSPASRYLQYKVVFPAPGKAGNVTLREIALAYLPQNQRGRVTEVTIADAPGTASGAASSATWKAHSAVLKLRWKVENPDADSLIYRVSYRQEHETVWRPLGGPEPLSKAEYDWNTDAVPDGRYLVRVWATDEKANPGERALDFTFVSPPFLVDNTRPDVLELAAKGPVVTGKVRDAASVITAVDYSIDGEDWRPVSPSDGLWDQRAEGFALRLPATVAKGPHVVNVRALDGADNGGTGRIEVNIP
jgi:hypothetical protein